MAKRDPARETALLTPTEVRTRVVNGANRQAHAQRQQQDGGEDVRQGQNALPESSRTNIGNVSTLDDAVAAFNPLCACPIPNASRLAPQAR
jgi:hypothetical protein